MLTWLLFSSKYAGNLYMIAANKAGYMDIHTYTSQTSATTLYLAMAHTGGDTSKQISINKILKNLHE